MRIYKYPLNIIEQQTVPMPEGAQLLDVQLQHGEPQLWALVDPDRRVVPRFIAIRGTGHEFDVDGLGPARHVATFQMQGGALVFHVFDRGER